MSNEDQKPEGGIDLKPEEMFASYERQIMQKATDIARAEAVIAALSEKLSEALSGVEELKTTVDSLVAEVARLTPKDQDKPDAKVIEHKGRVTTATTPEKPELAAVGGE